MDNSIERYILFLVNLQLFTCYALAIQNKVILQERSFTESKRVADCIYSYGTQSRAGWHDITRHINRYFCDKLDHEIVWQNVLSSIMMSSIHYKMLASENVWKMFVKR